MVQHEGLQLHDHEVKSHLQELASLIADQILRE